jgi:hypothetical protein
MTPRASLRIIAKALALFLVFDLLQAATHLDRRIADLPLLQHLVPPMARLDVMRDYPTPVMWPLSPLLTAHRIGRPKAPDEYRVAVLGDSGTFGMSMSAADAIPGKMTRAGERIGGRRVVAYNLSYQTPNTLKDLVILRHVLPLRPDAVVWFVSLYDLASDTPPPYREQVHIILRVNREDVREIAAKYGIDTWETRRLAAERHWWSRSVFVTGARYRDFAILLGRALLDSLSGGDPSDSARARMPWIGSKPLPPLPLFVQTGIDQPPMPNARWKTLLAGEAMARSRGVRLLVVNDPLLIAAGPGSERMYDSFFGRAIYDRYRATMERFCREHGIEYLDLWNLLPPEDFDETPQHYLPAGNARIARAVLGRLKEMAK